MRQTEIKRSLTDNKSTSCSFLKTLTISHSVQGLRRNSRTCCWRINVAPKTRYESECEKCEKNASRLLEPFSQWSPCHDAGVFRKPPQRFIQILCSEEDIWIDSEDFCYLLNIGYYCMRWVMRAGLLEMDANPFPPFCLKQNHKITNHWLAFLLEGLSGNTHTRSSDISCALSAKLHVKRTPVKGYFRCFSGWNSASIWQLHQEPFWPPAALIRSMLAHRRSKTPLHVGALLHTSRFILNWLAF